jgi:hypothetical protein
MHLADGTIVKDAIRRRIARLDELIAKLKPIREEFGPRVSTGGEYLLEHIDRQRRLDRAWLEDLLAEIEGRGIRDVADPASLAKSA